MPTECRSCGTAYSDYAPCCRFCERLREELLERLEPDEGVASLAVIASRAVNGPVETPERRWRVG